MTSAMEKYNEWLQDESVDSATKLELQSIAGEPKEIEDRFYKNLEFGTGGLRGVLGAGTNRMNKYTVGLAAQGLAQYIAQQPANAGTHSAVIAYDSRNQSPEFALETALVLAGNGIKAYLFRSLRPTPELSFAVRWLKASSGVVITASHNPPEYNGFKAYDANGCQYLPEEALQIIAEIGKLSSIRQIRKLSQDEAETQGLLQWIGEEVDEAFTHAVASLSRFSENGVIPVADFKVVFTPLHGAGNLPVRNVLKTLGFHDVYVVPEQELPDANFSTVPSPNPEERQAFTLAIELAKQKGADLVIGTDPDCDRMGVVVKNTQGEFIVLNGNQTGAILIEYLLGSMKRKGDLPSNGVVVKTIVTGELGVRIAHNYGVASENTLTGFKYIGEKMSEYEQTGRYAFLFGYEESYGYLAGTHCRDKDAVTASMLISDAAAYYKHQGKTLYDVLTQLYDQYGYYQETLESITLKGKEGIEQMNRIMESWRANPPQQIEGLNVAEVQDYRLGLYGLPKENVLKYVLEDGSWFCLRPSGTEPKMKIYFGVCGASEQASSEAMKKLTSYVKAQMNS